jgi:Mg-chelatase subunit ChlD
MDRRTWLKMAGLGGLGAMAGCSPSTLDSDYDITPVRKMIDDSKISVVFALDASGSMDEYLNGRPKIAQAKESLVHLLGDYQLYNDSHRNLEAALMYFQGNDAKFLQGMMAFDYQRLVTMVNIISSGGGTPMGLALAKAEHALDANSSGRRNIVMLTDGENTVGKEPDDVYSMIITTNKINGDATTSLYIITFNQSKEPFQKLETMGAIVKEAKDQAELNEILGQTKNMILEAPIQYKR